MAPEPRVHFGPARLTQRVDVGGGLSLVTIEPTIESARTHTLAGQYAEVRAEGQSAYFVMANEPGERAFEFLLRAGGGVADVLLRLPMGAAVEASPAIGMGFPLRASKGKPLVVALTGTGVAAARSLVRPRIANGDAIRTLLLVGARSHAELAMLAERRHWGLAGVRIVVCLSRPERVPPAFAGKESFVHGYVQDGLRSCRFDFPVEQASVFAVGRTAMIQALRTLALELGIPAERVHTNH